jgi:hypothetical protein
MIMCRMARAQAGIFNGRVLLDTHPHADGVRTDPGGRRPFGIVCSLRSRATIATRDRVGKQVAEGTWPLALGGRHPDRASSSTAV